MSESIPSIQIDFLADHPEAIPILKRHFESEWEGWYGPHGPGNAEDDLRSYSNRNQLPIGLVALHEEQVCGIAALKPDSIDTHRHLTPWAAAGWVLPELRGQGIGGQLLVALEGLAEKLGFPAIYCGTATATSLLKRNRWKWMETVVYHGEQVSIFRKEL